MGPDRRQAAAVINGVEGLKPFRDLRDHDVVPSASHQMGQKGHVEEGHVAGRHKGLVGAGIEEAV
jgi:hypothetical protein